MFTKDKICLEQLPLSYSSVGTAGPAPSSTYVDAPGCPLDVATTRIATLQFGDVAFKEKSTQNQMSRHHLLHWATSFDHVGVLFNQSLDHAL
jgi:hypothetical protein